MTDAQMLTLAMAVILPLSMLLHSNSRITEAKETLRAEMGELKQTLRLEIQAVRTDLSAEIQTLRAEVQTSRAEMRAGFENIQALL